MPTRREWIEEIRQRVAALGLEPTRETAIAEELADHLEATYAELRAGGADEAAARRGALAGLDAPTGLAAELARLPRPAAPAPALGESQRGSLPAALWQDARYAWRTLRARPGFTVVAIVTLALGIGAGTAIFSVVNAVMLRPLPFPEPQQLVRMWETNVQKGWPTFAVSHPNFLDWRDQSRSFAGLAATTGASFSLASGGDPEIVPAVAITATFLPALGVVPALGRNLLPEEDRPGGNVRVVLLSDGAWRRRFGGDRSILGTTLALNDIPYTVVGVLPPSFDWRGAELFVPLAPDPARERGDHRLSVVGRLRPGVSLAEASAELSTIAQRISAQFPDSNAGWTVTLRSFYDWIVPEETRRSLLLVVGAVGFLLLIACSNVANLLLARAVGRRREVSIRLALGARPRRIVAQLLVESVLLALAAGAVGLLVAVAGTQVLKSLGGVNLPRLDEVSVDARVVAFALLASMVTGVVFGLVPALQSARPDLNSALRDGGRAGEGAGRQRLRSVLVMAQVALSATLLVGAGLLLRSFWTVKAVSPGFEPADLLTMRVSLPSSRYPERTDARGFYDRVRAELAALPGVTSVSVSSLVPLAGAGNTATELYMPDRVAEPGAALSADWRIVSAGYFRTLGIPLRGRDFTAADIDGAPLVTIVSESLARRHWPGEDPIGKRLIVRSFGREPATVIGVAGDVRSFALDSDPGPTVYVSLAANPLWNPMHIAVRSRTDPSALAASARAVVRSIDPRLPLFGVDTLDNLMQATLGARRFALVLLGCFAGVALVLACVGLFGVMAYVVSQRTHEIGVRLALGARPAHVFRTIVGRGLLLALGGAAVGLLGALWLSRFVRSFLYAVAPTDPVTFAGVLVLLLGVAALACYVPARRAMRVDPMVALRSE